MDLNELKFEYPLDGEDFDITIESSPLKMKGMWWEPKGMETEKVIVYVHGMNSFIAALRENAEVFITRGYAFFACDHIGHGRSEGEPVSCTIDETIDETLEVIKFARSKYPNVPLFVAGHSMGGLIVLKLGISKVKELKELRVNGIATISPYISPCPARQITLFESVSVYLLGKLFPFFKIPTGALSYTEEVPEPFIKFNDENALAKGWLTPRMMLSCLEDGQFVLDNAENWPIEIPLLYIQGNQDNLVTPEINNDWARRVDPEVITILELEYGGHMVFECPYRKVVLREILDFCNKNE